MKNLLILFVLFLLVVIVGFAGFAQPMLGKSREYVLKTYNDDKDRKDLSTGDNVDGIPFVLYTNMDGSTAFIHHFDPITKLCYKYSIVASYDQLNSYMKFLNTFVRVGNNEWVNYGGQNIYWHLTKETTTFILVAMVD